MATTPKPHFIYFSGKWGTAFGNFFLWLKANTLRLNNSITAITKHVSLKTKKQRSRKWHASRIRGRTARADKRTKLFRYHISLRNYWTTQACGLISQFAKSLSYSFKIYHLLPLWLKKTLYYVLFFFSRICVAAYLLGMGRLPLANRNSLYFEKKNILPIFENYRVRPNDLGTNTRFKENPLLWGTKYFTVS